MEWLPSLTSVIVGALLGAGITWALRRDEYRHAAELRWDADKRAVYETFIAAANAYERTVFKLQQDPGLVAAPASPDPAVLDDPYERLQGAYAQVLLLAAAPLPFLALNYMLELVPEKGHPEQDGPYAWSRLSFRAESELPQSPSLGQSS